MGLCERLGDRRCLVGRVGGCGGIAGDVGDAGIEAEVAEVGPGGLAGGHAGCSYMLMVEMGCEVCLCQRGSCGGSDTPSVFQAPYPADVDDLILLGEVWVRRLDAMFAVATRTALKWTVVGLGCSSRGTDEVGQCCEEIGHREGETLVWCGMDLAFLDVMMKVLMADAKTNMLAVG